VSRERGGEDKAGRSMTEKAQRHVNRGGATGYGGEGSGADASNPGEREREERERERGGGRDRSVTP
jgi:hypothetical protein